MAVNSSSHSRGGGSLASRWGLGLGATTLAGFLLTLLISLAATPTSASTITLDILTKNVTISPTPGSTSVNYASHTVNITTSNSTGYHLTLSSSDNSVDMVLSGTNGDTNKMLLPVDGNGVLSANQWGYTTEAVTDSNKDSSIWLPLQSKNKPANIANTTTPSGTNHDGNTPDDHTVTYGAKVANNTEAGEYKKEVIYTVTTNPPPAPTIDRLALNDTALTGQQKEFAIEGTNLSTTSSIWIDYNRNGTKDNDEIATDIKTYPNTDKAETVVSFKNPISQNGAEGSYNLYVETDGGTAMLEDGFWLRKESVCKSGDNNSDCMVDIDDNMIPITYTGNEAAPEWTTTTTTSPNWYDYGRDKENGGPMWANAVTVKADKLNDYKGTSGVAVDNNDVLGYWVYIPRYAYEVQRRDATDKFVLDEYPLPDNVVNTDSNAVAGRKNSHALKNDFIIKFEKSGDTKKVPTPGCSTVNDSTLTAKDYRTECNLSREYGNATGTTWATHPVFIWRSDDLTINDQLNGIWVGKFETTGSTGAPTVLPGQYHKTRSYIGKNYDIAKSIGVKDDANPYGNSTAVSQNSHNLKLASSHMLKDGEWGAIAYLSASEYGAGTNNVQVNASNDSGLDGDGGESASITGCGPYANGNMTQYACVHLTDHQYYGGVGKLASTTNNVYGVYDMAGGAWEVVMGNYTDVEGETSGSASTVTFRAPAKPPYVDLYPASILTNNNQETNIQQCIWSICGGNALHETSGWGGDDPLLADYEYPWSLRGRNWKDVYGGIFFLNTTTGGQVYDYAVRVALLAI